MEPDLKKTQDQDGATAPTQAAAQDPAPTTAADASQHHVVPSHLNRTTGEKYFKVMRFAVAEAVILGLTAVIAFVAQHGKPKYGPVPNYLKKMQDGWVNMFKPLENKGGTAALFAGAAASTMVTFHGGNLFAPIMKVMQDKRPQIIDHFNKKYGKPGELEAGRERLKHEGKETWGDVLKGRVAAWAIVFASFFSADVIAGTDKKGVRHFDKFTDRVGRLTAGLSKDGKEIFHTPIEKQLTAVQKENKHYLFGKILALDVFATTAAIIIWNSVSKVSAIIRRRKAEVAENPKAHHHHHESAAAPDAPKTQEPEKIHSFASRAGERPADFRALAQKEPVASGIALQ